MLTSGRRNISRSLSTHRLWNLCPIQRNIPVDGLTVGIGCIRSANSQGMLAVEKGLETISQGLAGIIYAVSLALVDQQGARLCVEDSDDALARPQHYITLVLLRCGVLHGGKQC